MELKLQLWKPISEFPYNCIWASYVTILFQLPWSCDATVSASRWNQHSAHGRLQIQSHHGDILRILESDHWHSSLRHDVRWLSDLFLVIFQLIFVLVTAIQFMISHHKMKFSVWLELWQRIATCWRETACLSVDRTWLVKLITMARLLIKI